MPEGNDRQLEAIYNALNSARNLMPSVFALATDPKADTKARWSAFDRIYDFVAQRLEEQNVPLPQAGFSNPELTAEQVRLYSERYQRITIAISLLGLAYGTSEEAQAGIMWQAEVLVPMSPDPETGSAPLTLQDQVLLERTTSLLATELPEDWECFFRGDSEPLPRRKMAFARINAIVGAVWREHSLFARRLTPDQRQRFVVLAMMCHVPKEQWTTKDLEDLQAELVPVPEPDWDELARLAGPEA